MALTFARYLMLAAAALAVSACAPKKSHKAAKAKAKAVQPQPEFSDVLAEEAPTKQESRSGFHITFPKPECATENDTSVKPPPHIVQQDSILVERHFQRVIRRCNGEVKSDKIETVKGPSVNYEIGLQSFHFKKVISHEARVRNTCTFLQTDPLSAMFDILFHPIDTSVEVAKHFLGLQLRTIKGVLDTSPTVFYGQVKKGPNIIDYKFEGCVKWNEAKKECLDKTIIEEGTIFLQVNYSEKSLPGVLEVDDCKDKAIEKPE